MYKHELEHREQESWTWQTKAASVLLVGQQTMTPMLGINPELVPYEAPYAIVTNGKNQLNKEQQCPENSPFVILNAPGVGDIKMGVFSSIQTEEIMQNEPEGNETCYVGFVYGSEYDIEKNTDALREFILKNKPKRVIVFATSFGGMAMVDVLNRYHQRYPDDETEFALVMLSSPGEADDLQLFSRISAEALAKTPLGKGLVYTMTASTVMQHPGNNVLNGQAWTDASVAAADTPPHTMEAETKNLIDVGMNRLIVDIPVYLVMDLRDEVVNGPRAVETVPRRLGQKVIVRCITHPDNDKEFQNHGDLWVPKYRQYYAPTLKEIVAEINTTLDNQRKERERKKLAQYILLQRMGEKTNMTSKDFAKILAQHAIEGPVTLTLQQPPVVTVGQG